RQLRNICKCNVRGRAMTNDVSEAPHEANRIGEQVSSRFETWLLKKLYTSIGPAPLECILGKQARFAPPDLSPVATVEIRTLRALAKMVFDPEIGFGDAYTDGRVEVHGDLVRALEVVYST